LHQEGDVDFDLLEDLKNNLHLSKLSLESI